MIVEAIDSTGCRRNSNDKTALIVEGGALKSVFSLGLLDGFLRQSFNPFDMYIGVSAGACNLALYRANRIPEGLSVYMDKSIRKKLISFPRFLFGGHLVDLDFLLTHIQEQVMDDVAEAYPDERPLIMCATAVSSGEAVYTETNRDNCLQMLKASSALPLLYRNFPQLNGVQLTDGGVADSIPLMRAISMGAKHIMVVRTRDKTYVKKDTLGHKLIRWKLRQYPELVKTMEQRVQRYSKTIQLIRHPPAGIRITEICPPSTFQAGRFSRSHKQLLKGYQLGIDYSHDAISRWKKDSALMSGETDEREINYEER